MNIYLLIILMAILVEFFLNSLSGWLDVKNLKTALPSEFKGFYSSEKYANSQEYLKVNTRFFIMTAFFNLIVLLVVIFLGGFNLVDTFIRSFGFTPLANGLIFFGILFLLQDILSTPFSLYHTFVIEEKFGFNKTTPHIYLVDKLKSYALLLVLGGGILSLVLYIFENMGEFAWVFVWIVLAAFSVLLQPLFTTFIAPLFNRFTPLERGELRNEINKFSKKVGFPVERIDVMDGSLRTSKANAYFSGIGKKKRIALYDTLIADHSNKELLAIVAHEVGHYKKGHILRGIIISIIQSGFMLFMFSLFINNENLFTAFQMEALSIYGSLMFFSLLYSPLQLGLSVINNYISRKNEFEADNFAKENTGSGKDLISGLKKLTVNNLGNLTPHPLTVFLSFSHPPVLERIKALK